MGAPGATGLQQGAGWATGEPYHGVPEGVLRGFLVLEGDSVL